MFAGTSVVGTLLCLEKTMWKQLAKAYRLTTEIKTFNKIGYPTSLKEKNLEQITNIYSKLIFPGQYIPQET